LKAIYQLTHRSENRKTGPIAVSITGKQSCPGSCPLLGKGCYASYGPLNLHWQRVSNGTFPHLLTLPQFVRQLRSLPKGSFFRHNQAGDLPGTGERINGRSLSAIVRATQHLISWTYTHKKTPAALRAIASANSSSSGGLVINLSADSLSEADRLAATGAPVVVTLPAHARAGLRTPGGRLVAICPAQLSETTCQTCGAGSPLCARRERSYVIGFRAHGSGAAKVGAQ